MRIKIYSQRGAKGITKFGSIEWTSEEKKCIHFAEVAKEWGERVTAGHK